MKIIFIVLLGLSLMFANETQDENSNIVKTSELELFLFKIGFQSLLGDVDITKNKVNVNEDELKKLNSKIEIIMNELYKNKRVLTLDSSNSAMQVSNNNINSQEVEALKEEVDLLKTQMRKLLAKKSEKVVYKPIRTVQKRNNRRVSLDEKNLTNIKVDIAIVRGKPFSNSQILYKLQKEDKVYIESCDKYDWCKLQNENKYIAKYMLDL